MDKSLEQLLLDLKEGRVSRDEVKRYLAGPQAPAAELVRCRPIWRVATGTPQATADVPGHVVLLAGPAAVEQALGAIGTADEVHWLHSAATGTAERYTEAAVQVLGVLRRLLSDISRPRTAVRLVCPPDGPDALLAGLVGLLRVAALENPRIVPQLLLTDMDAEPGSVAARILAHRAQGTVRLRGDVSEVLTWQEQTDVPRAASPWREGGTYVVTGGLGGLGLLFARDLLGSVRNASLVLVGRSPLDDARRALLDGLRRPGVQVRYVARDVADAAGVHELMAEIRREHGAIHGVVHAAGVLRDGFLFNKDANDLRAVLSPKVAGAINLDAATASDPLDFFTLFSSVAAVAGNVGQGDYAAANAFLDVFAHHRDDLVTRGRRAGRSLSVNWPLWAEGSMPVDDETARAMREQTGMRPMGTANGIRVLHDALAQPYCQVMAVEGYRPLILRTLLDPPPRGAAAVMPEATAELDEVLHDGVVRKLKHLLSGVTGLPVATIDAGLPLERYGIDSIVVTRINRKLADTFADLPKTVLYEFTTLDALAFHLQRAYHDTCLTWTGTPAALTVPAVAANTGRTGMAPAPRAVEPSAYADGIAIVGMSGRFPQARDLREFWENLAEGQDSVTEIPEDRWALDGFYHPDRDQAVAVGLSYGKWGGFLDGFADFDPLFFAISPQEAMEMDPQERLFLLESWNALENAGYTRRRLADAHHGRVGVFAGISKTGFDLYGPGLWQREEQLHPLTSFASVANRVSYLLDLHGPSLPVDTMCSSSLSAIHEAMQHLRSGECDVALAGGVNLYLHPSNFTLMSAKRMLSDDGRCRSFSAGGNGFVPGEGVAVVVLKRLSDAERDGDVIHAVLRGSAVNHGGRTNGYTVPNPVAQGEVVRAALDNAGARADEVSFVEAHGTGTALGDPIEIDGLAQAFASDTDERAFCAIGSAKSNIGHLEAAAGIAGLLKVVLQMRHGELVPSLHAEQLNPAIDFGRTPFRLQRERAPWVRPTVVDAEGRTVERPRLAGVSSFGAGGSNAHVVVEEYCGPVAAPVDVAAPWLVVLSARDRDRLRERAQDLLDWIGRQDPDCLDIAAVAYTLQLGREPMDTRLALAVDSVDAVVAGLTAYLKGDADAENLYSGAVREHQETLAVLGTDSDMAATVETWIAKRKFGKLLDLWTKGLAVDWNLLYRGERPRMLALPGYPFARERYWVGDLATTDGVRKDGADRLHPLLHENTSVLDEQRFDTVFTGAEPVLTDHVVKGRKVLPGAAYLEIARAATVASLSRHPRRLALRDVVWARPLTVAGKSIRVRTALHQGASDEVTFEISSLPGDDAGGELVLHSRGVAVPLPDDTMPAAPINVAALLDTCRAAHLDADQCYDAYRAIGLDYGPTHRCVESVAVGDGQALARLRLPAQTVSALDGFVLHPGLLDGALQATVGLFARDGDPNNAALRLPFSLDEARIMGTCSPAMWAWVRHSADDRPGADVRKVDVDLLGDDGVPVCRLTGLTSRTHEPAPSSHATGRPASAEPVAEDTADGSLAQRYLVSLLADELRLPADRIEADIALEHYGIDSIRAMNLTSRLEQVFGPLPKTLFFEYQSIADLTRYFLDAHAEALSGLLGDSIPDAGDTVADETSAPRRPARTQAPQKPSDTPTGGTDIAIIGLAGRYPQARNLREFWRNLAEGRDCVTEVPADRWDHSRYFDPDSTVPGRTYTKWGGFLDKADHFDALFFRIAPREAAFMDPQERLFLECVHETLEDAGYTRKTLSRYRARGLPGNVGVYVGVMYTEYQLYGAQEQARGHNITLSASASTIANRVSYVYDLHGPSLAVDTMCSSSLTALHLACQSLQTGGCELAVAGGVNLSLHPNKFLMLGSGKYASSTGRCASFGAGGDGYVPAEGVGAVLLKPLARAIEDRDTIYGVIRATAVNHGGKTNGYAVPNPQAQYNVIGQALHEAGIDASSVGYVEAHGTGTVLGDPIEIAGLTRAFREYTDRTDFCAIGSVKSNIGHAESAAGIAALTKVLLQMKHGQLVPSLHAAEPNPNIDFADSPFRLQRELAPWPRPAGGGPRVAGISSFGAGGANAHVIVSEYQPVPDDTSSVPTSEHPAPVVLSARTANALRDQAAALLTHLTAEDGVDIALADLAYTLQVGREEYEERLGVAAASTGDLVAKLRAFLDGDTTGVGLYRGSVERRDGVLVLRRAGEQESRTLDEAIAHRDYGELLRLWTTGLVVDWTRLHTAVKPRRISLPTYPFQGERYWLTVDSPAESRAAGDDARLHPLLHANTSTLSTHRFTSVYSGEEFFLRDHQVQGRRTLSGAACLELARAAVAASLDRPAGTLSLINVVWTHPVVAAHGPLIVHVRLRPGADDEVRFEILTANGSAETVHGEGAVRVRPTHDAPAVRLDLDRLRAECARPGPDAADLYAAFADRGIAYGPGHRGVQSLWAGVGQVLARIALPEDLVRTLDEYRLHPTLVDAGLQACAGLLPPLDGGQPLLLPFAVDEVRVLGSGNAQMWAWARPQVRDSNGVHRFDIDLADDEGWVHVALRGVALRTPVGEPAVESPDSEGPLLATPVWIPAVPTESTVPAPAGLVLVAGLPEVAGALVAQDTAPVVELTSDARDEATRYTDCALQVLAQVKRLLADGDLRPVRVQLVAPAGGASLWAGLAGVLRSAGRENPRLLGQLVLVDAGAGNQAAAAVMAERGVLTDTVVRYRGDVREVLRWREEAPSGPATVPYRDGGVYLVTGGVGGLGRIVALDIAARVRSPRIILTGRSPRDAERDALLEKLRALGAQAAYEQADVGVREQVTALVGRVRDRYGRIDGVVHSAGLIRDAFAIGKDPAEFARVLAPKVAGLVHLDEATRDDDLAFLVAFSSVAAVFGNVGQADYAAANAFMDAYAAHRNVLVAQGRRRGRTLAVNWPLWAVGGMHVDEGTERSLRDTFGLVPLSEQAGLDALYQALETDHDQVLVLAGSQPKLRRTLLAGWLADEEAGQPTPAPVAADTAHVRQQPTAPVDDEGVVQRAQSYFKRLLASAIGLPAARIDVEASMEEYGVDSVMTLEMTRQLEKVFGSLPKTLFFEHRTLAALTTHFLRTEPQRMRELVSAPDRPAARTTTAPEVAVAPGVVNEPADHGAVAIIGLAGRYPGARDIHEFWDNLAAGRDCVTPIPADRWDHARFFDPVKGRPGKTYGKWGGFLDGAYDFDAQLFSVSPREAEIMDPQERQFLQCVHETLEDAGYVRNGTGNILPGRVGVFVGTMYTEYQLFGAQAQLGSAPLAVSGSAASIANRVSYYFNLRGPSLSVDTMCSSSLTAVHLACQSLREGDCEIAIAGGVNLSLHPNKYLLLGQGRFLSTNGRCSSFGAGGDGYVPGEGVGAIMLKPLERAIADGDRIYGVVQGTAVNHGGKTNGYSVPDPQAQADVIGRALTRAGVDPRSVSYVEAHGTGTALGDPIEIAGLVKAFGGSEDDRGHCAIGSVKSNIGHAESAAGIAGITKVLLQMRHCRLAPSLHAEALNAHIDFTQTPFVLQRELADWPRREAADGSGTPLPRIAGVSSFGAGGANAHVIIAEYLPPAVATARSEDAPALVPLSARTPEQLRSRAARLLHWLRRPGQADAALADIAWTLQIGREAMEERWAVIVGSVAELTEELRRMMDGEPSAAGSVRGTVTRDGLALTLFAPDTDLDAMVAAWAAKGKYEKLLDLWVSGVPVDWRILYGAARPRRIALPTYPFGGERYFPFAGEPALPAVADGAFPLHPLVQVNTSDFTEQRFTSVFTGEEWFLRDHVVRGERTMPAAAHLEMVLTATYRAAGTLVSPAAPLALRNVALTRPLTVGDKPVSVEVGLRPDEDGDVAFQIRPAGTEADMHAQPYSQGVAYFVDGAAEEELDLAALRAGYDLPGITAQECYEQYEAAGISYGPTHRAVRHIWIGPGQALAELVLPEADRDGDATFTLHPILLDAALQACAGMLGQQGAADGAVLPVPFAIDDVLVLDTCVPTMWAWIRPADGQGDVAAPRKFDIDMADDQGRIRVRIGGLSLRDSSPARAGGTGHGHGAPPAAEPALAVPQWFPQPLPAMQPEPSSQTSVLIVGLPEAATRLSTTDGEVVLLSTDASTPHGQYAAYALQILDHLRSRMRGMAGPRHVQLVIPGTSDAFALPGLAAILRSAHLENPALTGQLLILHPRDDANLAVKRIRENLDHRGDAEVRYLDGRREVLRWLPEPEVQVPPAELPWKVDGVYLITGGAGALGLVIAEEIAAQAGAAVLVLSGRSAPDARIREQLERLHAVGAHAAYYEQADIADRAATEALVARTLARCGRIDGVIHSAGVTRDGYLVGKSAQEFLDVLAPKVEGVVNLDAATRDLPLDFFVLFSSTSGVTGNAGQADYAAANAFLDAYAAYRQELVDRGERSGRSQSVNWPLWADGGMRPPVAGTELLRKRHGIVPLETSAGLRALYRILHAGHRQVLVTAAPPGHLQDEPGTCSALPFSVSSAVRTPS